MPEEPVAPEGLNLALASAEGPLRAWLLSWLRALQQDLRATPHWRCGCLVVENCEPVKAQLNGAASC